jgi:outer membrane lipoprotein carrier protein
MALMRGMRNRLLSVALLALALAAPAGAAKPSKSPQTLDEVLKEVQKRQSAVKTLQAEFVQEKSLALLAQPQVSRGFFAYEKPDKVLWRYDEPTPVTMLIASGRMTTYYPKLSRAETIEIGRFQDRIFKYMGAANAIGELSTWFNFRFSDRKGDATWKLELLPKTSQVSKRVKGITIWIDRQTFLTSKFEYIEADGDMTRYEFSSIRVNAPMPPATFKLALPPTVKVDRMKLD